MFSQVQQLVGVVNGTVMYNITPSILMVEWHSLYTTSLKYGSALQNLQTELNEEYFAAWIPGNISVGLNQILLTRSVTYSLFNFCYVIRIFFVENYQTITVPMETHFRAIYMFICILISCKTGVLMHLRPWALC